MIVRVARKLVSDGQVFSVLEFQEGWSVVIESFL